MGNEWSISRDEACRPRGETFKVCSNKPALMVKVSISCCHQRYSVEDKSSLAALQQLLTYVNVACFFACVNQTENS